MNEQTEAVQRMQEYIDRHLDEGVSLADLARVSLYSPWHSYRLFKQLTGLTPSDYVRRLRLTRSALMLRDERHKIADVAYEMGFGSVDGYQRAFQREFGRNPREYADNPVPIPLFTPYGVKFRELRKEAKAMQTRNVFVQSIDKPARKALVKRGVKADNYWDYCNEVGCDIWGLLTSMKSLDGEPVCLWLPQKYVKPNTSVYVQGVEVALDGDDPIPEGFDAIELPAAKYLMFQGEPFAEEDYCEAIDEVTQAIAKYDPSVIGCEWDDEQPRVQLEPVGSRGYIELRAIKKK